MSLADPWSSGSSDSNHDDATAPASLQFEDNFEPAAEQLRGTNSDIQQPRDGRLPDSDSYLAVLERRLKRIKTNPTVLQQLVERREACMQHLLADNSRVVIRGESELALDEPVSHHELLRFIRPEQALSVAELVHIVKYDHLEQEPTTEAEQLHHQDSGKEGEESGTESSTSR